MANDHSIIIVVPDGSKDNASKILAAFWGDDPPGTSEFSVGLSADGSSPATHWALHLSQNATQAGQLTAMPTGSGVVPSPLINPLSAYSLSDTDAQTACAAISCVSDMTGDVVPTDQLDIVCQGLGLQHVTA